MGYLRDTDTGISRRAVLKRGAIAAGVLGLGGLAGPAAANSTVAGGGDALQSAIDAASDGDTLTVTDSATYDPVAVDVAVTIETDADPTIAGGGANTAVSVAADGVTLDGLTVTTPDGRLGVKVERGVDDVTVVGTTVEDVGPTGRRDVAGILVGQGDHDGIEIANNTIRNLDQETTERSGFPTANGIRFHADNDGPGTVTDAVVNGNTIEGIESDLAALGIVVQHSTATVDVDDNEIRGLVAASDTDSDPSDGQGFGFTFAQGISIGISANITGQTLSTTEDTSITGNVIEDITSAEGILPEAVKIDGDGSGLTFRENQFLVAIGLNNRNGTDGGRRDPSADPEVDARNNWWGSPDGPEEATYNQAADDDGRSDVVGNVDFEPFLRQPPGNGNGTGGPN
ncbi:hypothetical protein EGH21_13515 [Halomicroarcula sp. F13]|uniref:Right handed beta helix domain-containing protein n=1 Tax=Haloarcula rubra TaxID=2487747 RepID=A0AAW4PU28_9EURY|nr:hypothetical protein [Halomicroarcula rubra]MBX0324050.1 hypothetical protein [Halomicroarcula rubra]